MTSTKIREKFLAIAEVATQAADDELCTMDALIEIENLWEHIEGDMLNVQPHSEPHMWTGIKW